MVDHFVNGIPRVPSEWVRDMTINLKARNHKEFQAAREALQDAYEGNNLKELTNVYFTNKEGVVQKSVPSAIQNILNRAIRRISLVYKNRPDYGVEDWPEKYDPLGRWLFFKLAERTANNVGTVLLRPVVRNDTMDYDLLTDYFPFFEDDPLTPVAILYSVTTPSADMREVKTEWLLWTADNVFLMNENFREKSQPDNPENINKYGILPFVTVNPQEGREYWRWGYGNALLDANTAINVALTEMRMGVRYTMMGQWVVTGVDDDTKIILGVDQTIKLPANATLEAVAPDANMSEAVDYIKAEITNAMQNIGLMVQFADDGGVPSGESLKVKNIELLERREDDVATWFQADTETYEVEKKIWEVDGMGGSLPERSVNYVEVAFPITPAEQQAQDQWDLDHNQITEAQILIRDNPDAYANEEEAQTQINENKSKSAPEKVVSGRSAFGRGNNVGT